MNNTLDEILDEAYKFAFLSDKAKPDEWIKTYQPQIESLILEAKIEELQNIDWKTGDGGYYFTKKRLAELLAIRKDKE